MASRDYTAQQINAWAPPELDPALWRQRMRNIKPFVAQQGSAILGYADLQSTGYIDHFFVSGHRPRQGIGSLLMKRLHEEAAMMGLRELSSDVSRTAQPFFERHGFRVLVQRAPVRCGVTIPNARMHKALDVWCTKA
jgi:putative acetyltransferase